MANQNPSPKTQKQQGDQNASPQRQPEQEQPKRSPSSPAQQNSDNRPERHERPIADVDRKVRGGDA